MKRKAFKSAIIVLVALLLCVSSFNGCKQQQGVTEPPVPEEKETFQQLLGFESYEEITGTKIAMGNMLGSMEINTDEKYLTQGSGSVKISVQGSYDEPAKHPYFKLDFLNTTCATCDFSKFKSISFDVYNDTDEELHVKACINVGKEDGNYIATAKESFALKAKSWTTCTYDLSKMAGFSIYDFTSVRYLTVEFMEHKQSRGDVPNVLYVDNLIGSYFADGEQPETVTYDFYEGIDFESSGKELLFTGQGKDSDASFERVSYDSVGIEAPENGGSYALRLSHETSYWPTFRINFGKELPAGTKISFVAYGRINGESVYNQCIFEYSSGGDATVQFPCDTWTQLDFTLSKYMKLELSADSKNVATSEDPNQVVWTLVETWKSVGITLTADSDHVDLFYNVADGQHGEVASWLLLDNFKAAEPGTEPEETEPEVTEPVVTEPTTAGDITEGIDFETFGDESAFTGTGSDLDATIERVAYADVNVTAPKNGGSYALKVSHESSCWPSFRVNFGKTLKAGTTVTFDVYGNYDYEAAAGENKYMKLELSADSKNVATSEDPNQVVWTLVETWKSVGITLTADSDYVDFFYNVADGSHGDVASWLLMDNFKAAEPGTEPEETEPEVTEPVVTEPEETEPVVTEPTTAGDITEGFDFETSGDESAFTGTGSDLDATIERVAYADVNVTAPENGGSYALKVSHESSCWPSFRVYFGKTLKAGTTITFDVYGNYDYEAAAGENKYMKLELSADSKNVATSEDPNQIVWTLVETWKTGVSITLTADSDHVDFFYNVADGSHGDVASWMLLDNFKAAEPGAEPEETEPEETEPTTAGGITEGIDFETAGDEEAFSGTGSDQDATIERVAYADVNVTAPENGGSYALKVSHASSCWPSFRINFGKTLKAGTTITFDVYGNYDYEAAAGENKYMKLELSADSKNVATSEDPNQIVWTLVETWKTGVSITLTADSDHVDFFYNVADGSHGNVPSWMLLDNFKAVEPGAEPEETEPTTAGDITEGIDFETAGDEEAFTGTGSDQDATIERVAYADVNVTAPENGGSYALKVSHASSCWPSFRINFGKTLKAGTTITFDAYGNYDYEAAAGVNKYMKLELGADSKNVAETEDPNQVVWTLVETWKTGVSITLTADSDHVDFFYNVADASHGNVPSWMLLDNFKAVEPEDENGTIESIDFETAGDEEAFTGTGSDQDATIERVVYADVNVTAPENGGSYALKVSHASSCWPSFRINFGKTLKAGTTITFDVYGNYDYEAAAGVNKYMKLELSADSKNIAETEDPNQIVWTLVETWKTGVGITLTADSDHVDFFYNVADASHGNVPSWMLLDNIKAVEPAQESNDITKGLSFEEESDALFFAGQGKSQDASIARVSYADSGITALTDGGSYALKLSHESNYWPTFRITFGKTLKEGAVITFWAYGKITSGTSLYNQSIFEYSSGGEATAQFKCDAWTELGITLTEDASYIDLFWNYDRASITSSTASGEVYIDEMTVVEPQ